MALDVSKHPGRLLDTLWQEWEHIQPRRAWGGRWSLAGFSFQASIFLLRFFQQIEERKEEPGLLAEMESLSDILCPKGGKLILTQVKLTLRRAELISAMQEAFHLTDLCHRVAPDLLEHLRFQIACRHREKTLLPTDLTQADVMPAGDLQIWQAMLDCFDPTAPIIVEADPLDRLHLFLWNAGLENPAGLLKTCQGMLLGAFNTPERVREVGRDLADLYHSAPRRTGWRSVGDVLTPIDITIDQSSADRGVLTGRIPQFAYLRRGYFRERPQIITQLLAKVRGWLARLEAERDQLRDRIPVFWISGRSGEGKSVLLLQAVAALLTADAGLPVVHLGTGMVPRLLEDLPERDRWLAEGKREILAVVDDLYNLQDRDGWGDAVRQASDHLQRPVAILTCGPTEQLEDFRHELGRCFAITDFTVPLLTAEEARAFFDWYHTRTGKEPDAALLRMENPILVLLMFELAQGMDMADFADRFKGRLKRLGLFDAARAIIAANALYLPAPLGLVETQHARDALARLCEEDQLHFDITPPDPGAIEAGVRLLHPHLARHLLPCWLPQHTSPRYWGRELAKSLACWLRAGDNLAAKRLIGRVQADPVKTDTGKALANLSTEDRLHMIGEFYYQHSVDEGGFPALSILHCWLALLRKIPALHLQPDPVSFALESMQDEARATMLRGEVATLVWQIASDRQDEEAARMIQIAQRFSHQFASNPGVGFSLSYIYNHYRADDSINQFVMGWLSIHGKVPETYQLIAQLVAGNPTNGEVATLARTWLENNQDHPQAYHVLAPLVAGNPTSEEMITLARTWLEDNKDHPQAYQLIVPMVVANPTSEEVVTLARTWLANNKAHLKAYHVIAPLVKGNPAGEEIVTLTRTWLEDNKDHPQAYLVLAPLVAGNPTSEEPVTLARTWLENNKDHPQAYYVIASLVAGNPTSEEMITLARTWLENNKDHLQAYHVLAPLVAGNPTSEEVATLARAWLENNQDHPQAYWLIAPLVKGNPTGEEVITLTRTWLENNKDHLQAYQVIAPLVAGNPTNEEVVTLARAWLEKNPDHPLAYWLITPLVKGDPNSEEVERLAWTWLDENSNHPQVPHLLSVVIARLCGGEKALQRGEEYLSRPACRQPQQIIAALISGGKADPRYVRLAMTHLDKLTQRHRNFILARLSTSLVYNPTNACRCLEEIVEYRSRKALYVSCAFGMKKCSDQISTFIEDGFRQMTTYHQGQILLRVINLPVESPNLDILIAEWLDANYRNRGYGSLLATLGQYPDRYQRIQELRVLPE